MHSIRCSKCKHLFQTTGKLPEVCPDCMAKRKAMLDHVRELVKANPGISPQAVSQQTGVPVLNVIKYITEGLS